MRILVSNDDGVFSEGLRALVSELHPHHDVVVVAPDMQRSGTSHASTFVEPVRVRKVTIKNLPEVTAYAASGTPADCVRLGVTSMGIEPELVVAGINHGANLGSHVLYSGTVGAAMEAALAGVPAIATSCCAWQPTEFAAAARASLWAVEYVRQAPLPPNMILNLNTPELPVPDIKGIKLTGLALQHYDSEHATFEDPRGMQYFWATYENRPPVDTTLDNDLRWVEEGYATLTPIHCDITCYSYMKTMQLPTFQLSKMVLDGK